jgi:hypothetical protein
MITRRNVHCLVTAGKHVNNIRAIARQLPVTTTEELLEAVFSAMGLYNKDPRPAKFSSQLKACEEKTWRLV